jgi:hypothetical protein
MTDRKYNRDEADAILSRTIERDSKGDLAHEDLVAAAREVGVSPEALEAAAEEVLAERTHQKDLAMVRREQRQGFIAHLIPYILVNGFLITINVFTTRFPWAIFPAFGWGIGLVLHLMAVVRPNPEALEWHLERRLKRERRRALRNSARANTHQIEQQVGEGVSAVLHAVAHRIAPVAPTGSQSTRVRAPSASNSSDQTADEILEAERERKKRF